MIAIITILILLACLILGFFILVQNPKGGGLIGSFGSMSSQVMGVKQSTDVMEKGTWILTASIAFLCIISVAFLSKSGSSSDKSSSKTETSAPAKKGK